MNQHSSTVVLVAEDDATIRTLLKAILEEQFLFSVLSADDGQEALEQSRTFPGDIALLITDMRMPRLNGSELCELLTKERPSIRILQISGHMEEWYVERNPGFAFLEKPFRANVLVEKVKTLLNLKSQATS